MYLALNGPLPVITIKIIGNCPSTAFVRLRSTALRSYIVNASVRILKSSSGVQDVLDTSNAGRFGRREGSFIGEYEGKALGELDELMTSVKGVEYGAEDGKKLRREGGKESCSRRKS
jgi:hypothetical protein